MTPGTGRQSQPQATQATRATALDATCAAAAERFINKPQIPPAMPAATGINEPKIRAPGH
jgi:hypothetical protein